MEFDSIRINREVIVQPGEEQQQDGGGEAQGANEGTPVDGGQAVSGDGAAVGTNVDEI